jgi:hypothetical protein
MDKKDWDIDANKLGAELKDSNQSLDKMTNKQAGTISKIAARVATQASIEEFSEFMIKGELPPVKLTSDEMEAMKGGFLGLGLGALFSIGSTIFGAIKGNKAAKQQQKAETLASTYMQNNFEGRKEAFAVGLGVGFTGGVGVAIGRNIIRISDNLIVGGSPVINYGHAGGLIGDTAGTIITNGKSK